MVLRLARASRGLCFPDPAVAALLVKNGKIISWGYHAQQGTPHAEAWAIRKAGRAARGSTLYINLEPCSYWGNNPPCADLIVKSGIKKVVASMTDPNPLVLGKGFAKLRKAGIEVTAGLFEKEAREINEAFVKHITTGRPLVTLKLAISLDGKIATKTGASRWISGPDARRLTHIIRGQNEAILVGVNTVIKDDPTLTCRLGDFPEGWSDYLRQTLGPEFFHQRLFASPQKPERQDAFSALSAWESLSQQILPQPIRIILDSNLRLPLAAKVVRAPLVSRTMIFTTRQALAGKKHQAKVRELKRRGVLLVALPARRGQIDAKKILAYLGRENISSVLVEGGSQVAASFIKDGLIDRYLFFVSPKIIGGDGIPAVAGLGAENISQAVSLADCSYQRIGPDLLVTARPGA